MASQCFYYDGLTAQRYECTIYISDECVYVYINSNTNHPIIWNRNLINHFDLIGSQLIIKYGAYPHQTIECIGEDSILFYDQLSTSNIVKQTKSIWIKNKITFSISLCFAFVIICLTSYFFILPWIGEQSVALIPKNAETELGNSIAESILQSSTEEDSATYYTNRFLSKLQTNTSYSIQITVIDSKEINAFALPGGRIFIYSGIIKKINSYEELVALIGHETSHVTEQHSLKSICRSAASSIFISFLFGDITGISSGILAQADQFKQLNYSRELETQADNKGFEFMIQNKTSPEGMVNLLTLLKTENETSPSYMKYFSTHPETDERIKNIQSKANVSLVFDKNEELIQIFNKIKNHLD